MSFFPTKDRLVATTHEKFGELFQRKDKTVLLHLAVLELLVTTL